ncbi:MAG: hypothetical protein H0W34_10115 [Pyrinomonadaceae bacterium]|nr:hypothetical protein [Pyrinomonadaceae bacterium]
MAWGYGPSVIHRDGCDYWRTWFLQECEHEGLFGLTIGHLPLVRTKGVGVIPYHAGTLVYLEDAPYFHATEKKRHRVVGPYEVVTAGQLPEDANVVHHDHGRPIVWHEPHPEQGPWLNRSNVKRTIDGVVITFRQMAGTFGYFPYRFRIKRAPGWKSTTYEHYVGCWLCA